MNTAPLRRVFRPLWAINGKTKPIKRLLTPSATKPLKMIRDRHHVPESIATTLWFQTATTFSSSSSMTLEDRQRNRATDLKGCSSMVSLGYLQNPFKKNEFNAWD